MTLISLLMGPPFNVFHILGTNPFKKAINTEQWCKQDIILQGARIRKQRKEIKQKQMEIEENNEPKKVKKEPQKIYTKFRNICLQYSPTFRLFFCSRVLHMANGHGENLVSWAWGIVCDRKRIISSHCLMLGRGNNLASSPHWPKHFRRGATPLPHPYRVCQWDAPLILYREVPHWGPFENFWQRISGKLPSTSPPWSYSAAISSLHDHCCCY